MRIEEYNNLKVGDYIGVCGYVVLAIVVKKKNMFEAQVKFLINEIGRKNNCYDQYLEPYELIKWE